MGRKVHPYGFRLGIIKPWRARWFAEGRAYGDLLQEDLKVRDLIDRTVGHAGIGNLMIERFPRQLNVTIHTAKPGIIIGRKGASVEQLRKELAERTGKAVKVDVVEIASPETSAPIVAQSMAQQLERRISHKRAMKQTAFRAMRAGAQGIKIVCSGRLGGSEMSRTDKVIMGRVPRQTLRADIDFHIAEALTTYGRIGVKVWVYHGEVLPGDEPLMATDADFKS
ncbi:MAG: 30S ribosomal protein S3 [Ardenticatenales bacterium]